MKKIGIMTWYTYNNFGSLLQAYALEKSILKMGYDIELINYIPKTSYMFNYSLIKRISKKVKNIKIKKGIKRVKAIDSNERFDEFRKKYLKISNPAWTNNELNVLNDKYDAFICGSDQIWAPTVFDENYFLGFVSDNDKKIAYAPSIGLPVIENKEIKDKMKELISSIPNLSVREQQGQNLIYELCNRKAKLVLDPTLLLSSKEWKELAGMESENFAKGKYMLCYFLGDNQGYIEIARKLARKYKRKLLIIPTKQHDFRYSEAIRKNIGPIEFINYIRNSECVFTDSFHGTIFSLNLNIPFVTFKRFKDDSLSQNSRIYNILDITQMKHRLYQDNYKYLEDNLLKMDFNNSNEEIENYRNHSLEFLSDSLKKACRVKNEERKTKIITSLCTGCGVCAVACPKKCISIKKDENGFYCANIDSELCIHCNICSNVCGQNIERMTISQIRDKSLVAGYVTDKEMLNNVSSGGVCSFLSEKAMEKGIPVIGVKYNSEKQRAEHIVAYDLNALQELRGSKYLQSYTIKAFEEIKNLKNGVIVGTPCQISSLALYLKRINKRDKFLLVDLICHGVPSYLVWDRYIEKKRTIKNVKFRDKKYGWRTKTISYTMDGKVFDEKENKNLFYHFFNSGEIYNKSCYECSYRDQSLADLRVADYWGPKYEKVMDGRSMLIPITDRGSQVIDFLKKDEGFCIEKGDIKDCLENQQMYNTRIPLNYQYIINDLKSDKSLKRIDFKYIFLERLEIKIRRLIQRMR